ncbi:MAG: hypothetical protein ACLQO7_02555 [Candidatus Bathyarchaeia archaeon]
MRNVGASETIIFVVANPAPFLTSTIFTVFGGPEFVMVDGSQAYFKKRRVGRLG